MSISIERTIRQFWLPGINAITGKSDRGLQGFLLDDRYRIYDRPTDRSFVVTPFEPDELKKSFCHDLSRMASASFESMRSIVPADGFDKSCAWSAIRAYYAAFFSAHAFLRMFGVSCVHLDSSHVSNIAKVATYTDSEPPPLGQGLHKCEWNEIDGTLLFTYVGGSHEPVWNEFSTTLLGLSDKLLQPSAIGLITDLQEAATDLDKMRKELSTGGLTGGNWLSATRNRINYRHDFSLWYPYGKKSEYYKAIWAAASGRWLLAPLPIRAIPVHGREIEKLMELSGSSVALCRTLIEHIDETCMRGKSFVNFGPKSFIDEARATN